MTTLEASSFTDWLGAISTATLGALALILTVWQWRASGFRPKVSALIDPNEQGIAVEIVNKGRATGVIHQVDVLGVRRIARDCDVEGFADKTFVPTALPGLSTMTLIFMARRGAKFDKDDEVKVGWGQTRKYVKVLPVDVGLFGLKSVKPPPA